MPPPKRIEDTGIRSAGVQKIMLLAIGGLAVACGFAFAALKLYNFSIEVARPDLPDVVVDAPQPMPAPDLAAAPPLPGSAEVAAAEAQARELQTAGGGLPVWAEGCDPVALAWAASAPAVTPRRVGAWELYRAKLLPGTPVLVRGTVIGQAPVGERPWRRVAVAIDGGAWVEVLVPAAIDLAERIEASGTFLGLDELSTGATKIHCAVVAAPSVVRDQSAPAPIEPPAFREWPAIAQDPRWQAIDDHSMVDDTGPYYAMLGIVASDPPAAAELPLLNTMAGKAYNDAPAYRGRPVRVTGTVISAWEDPLVAADHPAGIQRVRRVFMHHLDAGPVTEASPDGKTRMARMSVVRLYEVALLGDGPLPKPGDQILAEGRFLRLVARPYRPRPGHVEAGDRAYSMFAVCRSSEVLANQGLGMLPRWRAGVMVVSTLLGGWLIWHGWRQRREYRELAARLAVGRRQRAEVAARSLTSGAIPQPPKGAP